MSQPFKLYRLQNVDSQIDNVNARLQEIEKVLNDNNAIRRSEIILDAKQIQLDTARKSLRRAEDNVLAQQIKIEQTEATLYGGMVRNPKELQDLHNEAAALKRYLRVLEDRQLEAMIGMEDAEPDYKTASSTLDKLQKDKAQLDDELTKEEKYLLHEMERLENERHMEVASITNEDLTLYDNLRVKRRGVAVAKATDKTCAAYGSTLTTALLQAARSPNKITRCESCWRILYGG